MKPSAAVSPMVTTFVSGQAVVTSSAMDARRLSHNNYWEEVVGRKGKGTIVAGGTDGAFRNPL